MNPSKITYLGLKEDYQRVVILLWRDAQINVLHRIDGKLYTEMNGSDRYQYAEIDLFFSRWSTSNYEFYGNFDTAGLGSDWSLVTCTYNGEKWWALRHTNEPAVSMYFMGSTTNISFTKVHYYTSNTGTVVNSEVNSSIASKGDSISVRSVNGSPYALQKDINALSSVYVKKAGDEMTGRLQLKNAAEFSIRMQTDTSNYRRGIIWNNAASDTRIAEIGYQNNVQRIFLNPLGSTEVWNDAARKYSFIIGNNFLTYNTWTILHSNNSTNYASGSVKVADSSIDNINNTNRAGSSRVNFFETYGSGDIMPTTHGNTMEICSTRSVHWQPQLYFSSGKGGHIYYRNKDYNISGFGSWKQLIDSENYSSILNSTYVKKAGDTMTGNLVVGTGQTTASISSQWGEFYIDISSSTTGGWERGFGVNINNSSTPVKFGFYGAGQSVSYAYAGLYSNPWQKWDNNTSTISTELVVNKNIIGLNREFSLLSGDEHFQHRYWGGVGSYSYEVLLLLPIPATTNLGGLNTIDGTISGYTNGANQCFWVDVKISTIYNTTFWNIKSISSFLSNQYVLKKCKYNDIWYYCIEIPYRDNRIDSYYFRGVIRSTIAGGLSTITLPYRIKYKTKANGNNAEVINNSEINSSLSTTLTQGGITYVSSIEDTYYQNIKPHLSNSIFLGTTDLRWKCVYSYNLDISSTSTFGGEATFNGGMYSGNIFPLSNNNYRIGSFSNRFIDAYIQAWVYANSGLYMNPSGITQNGSYLELSSGGNEIIIAGGTDFYVNYRGASYGGRSVPEKWYWRAGSSSSWANMEFGNCTLHGLLNSTGISASGANSFNVGARFSNTSHDSIEIVGGNYTMGLGCHSNGYWLWWRGTANPTISTNKSYVMAYDGSTWAFTGSITATAAITAKATSDFRLKENYDGLIDYRERLLKLGRVYDYNYNKKALDLYQDRIDNKRHTGLVYQNAVKAGITNFCHEKDEYGYGSLNYLSPDLIATIIGSVQANILSIRLVESEQERMRKELEHAKSEINRLKGLVASLQN